MLIHGTAILSNVLKSAGVDTIFYLLGHPTLFDVCFDLGIKMIDVRNEQAAAMMAHAYSRVTGRPGVCITGPGADTLNITTGIANAFMDPSPVVAIGLSASRRTSAMDAFQDVDQFNVIKPIVKEAWQVPLTARIPFFVDMAMRSALTGRPGPVYLEIPGDVLDTSVEESEVQNHIEPPVKHRPMGDQRLVIDAIEILAKAQRPIILSGNGVLWSDASLELQEFINITNIPFFPTPLSRGVIPEDHPLCFLGATSIAWCETDAILVVGTRSSFIVSYLRPPYVSGEAKIIEINIDAQEIGHTRRADVGIQGDARETLKQLIEESREKFANRQTLPWVERLRKADEEHRARDLPLQNSNRKPIHPLRLCKEIRDVLPRDAILVEDGQDTMAFSRHTIPSYYPGHRHNPGVSGCIGIGVPFGIGAKVAKPEKAVMVLSGDGSFGYHAMEMDTAVRHKLPIVVVISNNGGWTAKAKPGRRTGRDLGFTRYDKLVGALGCYSEFVEQPEDIRGALERAFACGGPALVNVITDEFAKATTRPWWSDSPVVI